LLLHLRGTVARRRAATGAGSTPERKASSWRNWRRCYYRMRLIIARAVAADPCRPPQSRPRPDDLPLPPAESGMLSRNFVPWLRGGRQPRELSALAQADITAEHSRSLFNALLSSSWICCRLKTLSLRCSPNH
jgi:hypothetical protein